MQVPLFLTADVDGKRTVTGIEPVFSSRLNPGNTFLVIIEVKTVQAALVTACRSWQQHAGVAQLQSCF